MRRSRSPARTRQLAHSAGSGDLRPKVAGAPHTLLHRKRARAAGCQHRLFFSQVEFCDNLIFRRRAALDNLGQRLLDANRTIGQPNKITVIFGRKVSKQYRGKLQTEIEVSTRSPLSARHRRSRYPRPSHRPQSRVTPPSNGNKIHATGTITAVSAEALPPCGLPAYRAGSGRHICPPHRPGTPGCCDRHSDRCGSPASPMGVASCRQVCSQAAALAAKLAPERPLREHAKMTDAPLQTLQWTRAGPMGVALCAGVEGCPEKMAGTPTGH